MLSCNVVKNTAKLQSHVDMTDLDLSDSVAALGLVRMVEPLDSHVHGPVPSLPEARDSTDVRHVTSGRDEHCTVTDLQHDTQHARMHLDSLYLS